MTPPLPRTACSARVDGVQVHIRRLLRVVEQRDTPSHLLLAACRELVQLRGKRCRHSPHRVAESRRLSYTHRGE